MSVLEHRSLSCPQEAPGGPLHCTVLSLYHREPPRLHPWVYYSRKLSLAERNYDIGSRELLTIKLVLEEWRHWLKGAQHPFTVITDHKNLEYIWSAKRLNPRQARWTLFFTRFQFSLTDPEIRMSRLIHSLAFIPLTNPPHLNHPCEPHPVGPGWTDPRRYPY